MRLSLSSTFSSSTSTCPSPVFFFPSTSCTRAHTELGQPDRHAKPAQLREQGSDDAHDVHTSLTGCEPNFMAFSELNDSSGSFSYIVPSSDQDMDDVTLGKLLTEEHRGQADYRNSEGVSVSQSVSQSVVCCVR